MAEPTILSEGTTPRLTDSRWRTLVKVVGAAYNNAASPDATDKPAITDTLFKLRRKLLNILGG